MPKQRYLTASKISLLILVDLYCKSEIPVSATIPVLSFVLAHTFPTSPSSARTPPEQHVVPLSIKAFEDILVGHASNIPGGKLLDVFLRRVWQMSSVDSLFELFDHLVGLLAPSGPLQDVNITRTFLLPTSPLGAFVRRARLEFTRLPFDDIVHLWSAFIAYRAPTAHWAKRLTGLVPLGQEHMTADMGLDDERTLFQITHGRPLQGDDASNGLSLDELERILEFQLDKLQRLGCRVPEELKTQLRHLLESSDTVPRQAHLVLFFDAWKSGDYSSAFDKLHRYFDYAMQARERIHYQYALLHMAILQADFGCFGEAIATINETVATARENQDIHCLNFSLNWLNHMGKAYPEQMRTAGHIGMLGSEREALAFLKAKARETKTYNLLSATLLNEAKLCLLSGDLVSRAFEHLYQSYHLCLRESTGNHGSHLLFQSALYSRLGNAYLSEVYCQLLLDCYQGGCPLDERIRAIGRRSFLVLQKGRYDEALGLLASADEFVHGSLKLRQYTFLCTGLVKLKRAIHHTDWTACEVLFTHLHPDSLTDPELTFLLSQSRIDYLTARGLYSQAWGIIEKLSTALRDEGADVMQRASLLIAKAELYRRVGHPERGFSVALRAASVAFKARLETCLYAAVGLLANILNSNADYSASVRLLNAVIPKSLENGGANMTGTLYSHLGDAYMGLAGVGDVASPASVRLRANRVSRAEMYIDRARECFQMVEDVEGECEQLMKKAIMAKLRGDEDLAEEWAQSHSRVWEQGMERITNGGV